MTRDHRHSARSSERSQPQDTLQHHLVRTWQRLLSSSDIGVDDDFFELGGSEDLARRMLIAVPATFGGTAMELTDVGTPLTVRRLAEILISRIERQAEGDPTMQPRRAAAERGATPQHVLEDQLLAVWETWLGRESIGVNDDFFTLGGNGELVSRMLRDVEALCGLPVSLADVGAPLTVRTLSDHLVLRAQPTLCQEVQSGLADVAPLFFLHGDFGGAGYYVREVARHLGPERPVYALGPHGIFGDRCPPSVEAMAADHVRHILDVYPNGPLHLAGLCIAGVIAWEMAQALSREGREVASLILIDPPIDTEDGGSAFLPPPTLSERAKSIPRVRASWLIAHYMALFTSYRCQPYAGRVSVVWAENTRHTNDSPRRRAALRALAPQLTMSVSPGTHISAAGRHARSLAAEVQKSLRHAAASGTR
jgi:hypothetical protein